MYLANFLHKSWFSVTKSALNRCFVIDLDWYVTNTYVNCWSHACIYVYIYIYIYIYTVQAGWSELGLKLKGGRNGWVLGGRGGVVMELYQLP